MPQTKLHVELIRHTLSPEEVVALGAKLCYSSSNIDGLLEKIEAKDQSNFVEKVMGMGHASMLEHVSFTFGIEGVSRALLAQLTRHRIASFSVQSQRYVSYKDGFNYIIPPAIETLGEEKVDQYKAQMELMHSWYTQWQEVLGNKGESSNEDARFVLPNACETRLILTMNARELLHFFSLRMCERAQWEIRTLANEMFKICYEIAPAIFQAAGPGCLRGACPEGSKSCGQALKKKSERFEFLVEKNLTNSKN